MGKFYFQHSDHSRSYICECDSIEECLSEITKFLEKYPNFHHYYTRYYGEDEVTFDVGSYTEFFKWIKKE